MSGQVIGIIGAVVAVLGMLGGGLAYAVNQSVNYGRMQATMEQMTTAIADLNHHLDDTENDLDGLGQFLLDVMASRNVVTPLELRNYQTPHTHDGLDHP